MSFLARGVLAVNACRRFRVLRFLVSAIILSAWLTRVTGAQTTAKPLPPDHAERMAKGLVLFEQTVAGLLTQHCVKCHGGEKTRGDFDLATREGLVKGGESGPAVTPFDVDASPLLKLITHEDEPKMPAEAAKLPDAAIQQIRVWIEHGAPYDKPLIAGKKPPRDGSVVTDADRQWWAFQPLKTVTPPKHVEIPAQGNDVDRFILAKAKEHGLTLPPRADARRLLRRATFDLHGIPPTPEELAAFQVDQSSGAWNTVVTRLLDGPQYGERWARHWLDVARFAESAGFEHDYDRPGAWAYRDFVIKALNADMPFQQFTHWQLAGDELAPEDPLALSATGFLGAGVFPTQITANEVERTRYDALDDMLSTTSSAFLGLTVGCARCHDHKFDPIPTRDYYRMLSTFTTTVRSNIDVELDPQKSQLEQQTWETALAPLTNAVQQRETQLQPAFDTWLKAGAETASEPTWTVLELNELKSQAGAKFTRQPDGSYLASGPNGNSDVYTATVSTKLRKLTGLRLEALADPSMPQKGPGRAANGNFGLSRITVRAGQVGGELKPVALVKPQVTFEQNNSSLSIAASLDDNPSTGWAVDPQFGKDHAAVFTFGEPIDFKDGTQLTVTLEFQVNSQHNIGRPRFEVITDVEPSLNAGTLPMAVAELLQKRKIGGELSDTERKTLFDWWKTRDADWRTGQAKVDDHLSKRPKTTTEILICGEGYKPMRHHSQGADFFEQTHILDRGSTDRKRDVATQSFLQVLMPGGDEHRWKATPPEGAKFSGRRTAMARWLTDVVHGAGALTARVIVNRLWQHHFGTGLVSTPNDFGQTGTKPSHPELLDWLAAELIRHDWKLKPIHRLLMTSATYQQATARSDSDANDAAVALFLRREPQRLEGESLRDSLLAISGKLDRTMYGPGTKDERSPRRSIYFTMKRSQLIGSMVVFDQPEPLVSQGSRPVTTVAPQALLLMNGAQVREWAETLARHVETEANSATDFSPAIQRVFAIALNRPPTGDEFRGALTFLESETASYVRDGHATPRTMALADLCQVIFALNEFAYVD